MLTPFFLFPDEACLCSLRMYNNVVERCFRDCVDSFRRKDLESSEERVSTPECLPHLFDMLLTECSLMSLLFAAVCHQML